MLPKAIHYKKRFDETRQQKEEQERKCHRFHDAYTTGPCYRNPGYPFIASTKAIPGTFAFVLFLKKYSACTRPS